MKRNWTKNRKNIAASIGIIIVVAIVGYIIYFLVIFKMTNSTVLELEKIKLPNQDMLIISYDKGCLLNSSGIRVKKVDEKTSKEYNLDFLEYYNYLENASYQGDSLILILKDTAYSRIEIIDTFYIYPDIPVKYMFFYYKDREQIVVDEQSQIEFWRNNKRGYSGKDIFSITKSNSESSKSYTLKWFDKYNYLEKYILKNDSLSVITQRVNYRGVMEYRDTLHLNIQNFEENKDLADEFEER